jgi:hypothetical protein
MSDETAKSAWPLPPAPRGQCHVRILVQDRGGLTSEVSLTCVNWDLARRVQDGVRAFLSAGQEGPSSGREGLEPKSDPTCPECGCAILPDGCVNCGRRTPEVTR